jgi:hypothetical protein
MIGIVRTVAALLLPATVVYAGGSPLAPRVGQTYEITLTRDSAQQGSNDSSGSSHDTDTIIERVIGLRADGLELQYELPDSATSDERARSWQFPARVFKLLGGPMQLLNGPELETRRDSWLEAAGWSRTVCGQFIFTWNAFRIECDPQSVIKALQSFDLRSADVREGAPYLEAEALGSGKLARKPSGPDGAISIAFETDPVGNVRRRTKVTKLNITGPDGRAETQTVTETLERRIVPSGSAG